MFKTSKMSVRNENAQRRCKPVWGLGLGGWEGFLCWPWSGRCQQLHPSPLPRHQSVYTGRSAPACAHSGLDQPWRYVPKVAPGEDIQPVHLTLNLPTNLSSVAPSSSLAFPLNSSYVFTQSSKGPNSASSSLLYSCRERLSASLHWTFLSLTYILTLEIENSCWIENHIHHSDHSCPTSSNYQW